MAIKLCVRTVIPTETFSIVHFLYIIVIFFYAYYVQKIIEILPEIFAARCTREILGLINDDDDALWLDKEDGDCSAKSTIKEDGVSGKPII